MGHSYAIEFPECTITTQIGYVSARDDLQWTKKDNSIRPIYLKWNGGHYIDGDFIDGNYVEKIFHLVCILADIY